VSHCHSPSKAVACRCSGSHWQVGVTLQVAAPPLIERGESSAILQGRNPCSHQTSWGRADLERHGMDTAVVTANCIDVARPGGRA
jgi:hypothetical protein